MSMGKRTKGKEIKGKKSKDKPKAKIYVFTEGKTEEIYLKNFERREYNVQVIPIDAKCTNATGIVKFAKHYIEIEEIDIQYGDRAYCVFDSDPESNPDIQNAFNLVAGAAKRGLHCIFSNPSFEVWFILHKMEAPYHLTAQQMKKKLKKILENEYPNYVETTDIYEWLYDNQEAAFKRAMKLHDSQARIYDRVLSHECNPYTNIFEFIEHMNQMKNGNCKPD